MIRSHSSCYKQLLSSSCIISATLQCTICTLYKWVQTALAVLYSSWSIPAHRLRSLYAQN